MIQMVASILRRIEARGHRAVLMVPETVYPKALMGLACLYDEYSGRSVRMPNGELATIISTDTKMVAPDKYDLYLCGWGEATARDERELASWIKNAKNLYVEID